MRTPPLSPAEASLNLPLPRPPAWIWLFTTQTGPGSALAAASASDGFRTGLPAEIGTPNSFRRILAWYSWVFIWSLPEPSRGDLAGSPQFWLAYHIPQELQPGFFDISETRFAGPGPCLEEPDRTPELEAPKTGFSVFGAVVLLSGREDRARSSCRRPPAPER